MDSGSLQMQLLGGELGGTYFEDGLLRAWMRELPAPDVADILSCEFWALVRLRRIEAMTFAQEGHGFTA
jgi:hypothetical protein